MSSKTSGSVVHTFHQCSCAINKIRGIITQHAPENHLLDSAQSPFKQVQWTKPHTHQASNAQAKLRLELLVCDAIIRRRTDIEVTTCEQCDDDRQTRCTRSKGSTNA
jgi:hypothetical protein